jgi:hypothetical protein
MSTVARLGTTYGTRRLVDPRTRASAIALHTVWGQTLGAVTAGDAMRDLEDFLRLLERPSVVKALAWNEEELVGVSFLTNELDMVPGISSEFFRARYPKESAEASVWYMISGVAHPIRPGVLDGLRRTCVAEARNRKAAVLLWDSSTLHTESAHRSTVEAVESVFGEKVRPDELDKVSYMAVELPPVEEGQVIDLRLRGE